ncbi:hypothetical protein KI387_042146, partial [Taxus chinensis]
NQKKDKGMGMVSVKLTEPLFMPTVMSNPELEPILVTPYAKAACTREIPKQRPLITREEILHGKYPDLTYQKEVYQETMEVIRSLQGEIQCLKEQSWKLEQEEC